MKEKRIYLKVTLKEIRTLLLALHKADLKRNTAKDLIANFKSILARYTGNWWTL